MHGKTASTSIDVVKYFENIYARNFHGQVIEGFTPELIENMKNIYGEYRKGVISMDQTYQRLFLTGFYQNLKFMFDAKINETLGLEVVKPRGVYEVANKMRLIFEDGNLIS